MHSCNGCVTNFRLLQAPACMQGEEAAFLAVGKGAGASLLVMPLRNHTHRPAEACDKSALECPAPCPCETARWRGPRCVRYAFHVRRTRRGRPLPPGRPSETPDLLLAHEIATREATLVNVGATIASSPHRRDDHRLEPARIDPCKISHAERVQGVHFGETEARPVPARAPSAPGANGQPQLLELAQQRETRRVDRGGVPERGLSLRLHLWVAELGRRPVALGTVAVVACQYEVGHAIGAAPAAGQLVIELEGHLALATIRAAVPELLQQIGPRLPASQFTPLILEAANFRILQKLRIKCDAFHLDAPDGRPPAIAPRPAEHIADPRVQRG